MVKPMSRSAEELAALEREIPIESQSARWRREDNEAEEQRRAAREEERQRRERAAHAASRDWDAHIRGIVARELAEEHERMLTLLEGALAVIADDLRQETVDAIRLAFLERGGGLTPRVRGTYRPDEKYERLDIVVCNGAAFIARTSDPGECPTSGDWQLMSRAGKTGQRGERGERGPPGPPGPQGEVGGSITGWKVDREKFRITPLLKGGHYGPPVDLLPLFQEYDQQIHGGVPASKAVAIEPPPRRDPAPIVRIVSAPAVEPPIEEN
jgi:hypothetical protein